MNRDLPSTVSGALEFLCREDELAEMNRDDLVNRWYGYHPSNGEVNLLIKYLDGKTAHDRTLVAFCLQLLANVKDGGKSLQLGAVTAMRNPLFESFLDVLHFESSLPRELDEEFCKAFQAFRKERRPWLQIALNFSGYLGILRRCKRYGQSSNQHPG